MDVLSRTPPRADKRLPYGSASPLQFGDLWLPAKKPGESLPVIVFVHGGWWKSEYSLDYAGFLCARLKAKGIAVWSLEYRRVGDAGGGWPGSFQDVAAGFDFVKTLAPAYEMDLARVATSGHSAGGHLAMWLAGRHHIPATSPLHVPVPQVAVHAVVSLAGAVDLQATIEGSGLLSFSSGGPAVESLLGGTPKKMPERYAAGDPAALLPFGVPLWLVQGSDDDQIPPAVLKTFADKARRQGDHVTVDMISGADHFDVVDPESRFWPRAERALLASVGK